MPSSYSSDSDKERRRIKYNGVRRYKKRTEKFKYSKNVSEESERSSKTPTPPPPPIIRDSVKYSSHSSSYKSSENTRKVLYSHSIPSRHHRKDHKGHGKKITNYDEGDQYVSKKEVHNSLHSKDYKDYYSPKEDMRSIRHRVISPNAPEHSVFTSSRDASSYDEDNRRIQFQGYSTTKLKRYKGQKHRIVKKIGTSSRSLKEADRHVYNKRVKDDDDNDSDDDGNDKKDKQRRGDSSDLSSKERYSRSNVFSKSRKRELSPLSSSSYNRELDRSSVYNRDPKSNCSYRRDDKRDYSKERDRSSDRSLKSYRSSVQREQSHDSKKFKEYRSKMYDDEQCERVIATKRRNSVYSPERRDNYVDNNKSRLLEDNFINNVLNRNRNHFMGRNKLYGRFDANLNRINNRQNSFASIRDYYMRGIQKIFGNTRPVSNMERNGIANTRLLRTDVMADKMSDGNRFKGRNFNYNNRTGRSWHNAHKTKDDGRYKKFFSNKGINYNRGRIFSPSERNTARRSESTDRSRKPIDENCNRNKLFTNKTGTSWKNYKRNLSPSGLSDISDSEDNAIGLQDKMKDCDNEQQTLNDSDTGKAQETSISDKLLQQPENVSLSTLEDLNEFSIIDELTVDLQREDEDKQSNNEDSSDETDLFTVSRISDILGVDWECLVTESKKDNSRDSFTNIRERWDVCSIFDRIGISSNYAGAEIFKELKEKMCCSLNEEDGKDKADTTEYPFLHSVAALHTCLKERSMKRNSLFEPYKKAVSVRKDISIRRQLSGLPVKSTEIQKTVGLCHWIV